MVQGLTRAVVEGGEPAVTSAQLAAAAAAALAVGAANSSSPAVLLLVLPSTVRAVTLQWHSSYLYFDWGRLVRYALRVLGGAGVAAACGCALMGARQCSGAVRQWRRRRAAAARAGAYAALLARGRHKGASSVRSSGVVEGKGEGEEGAWEAREAALAAEERRARLGSALLRYLRRALLQRTRVGLQSVALRARLGKGSSSGGQRRWQRQQPPLLLQRQGSGGEEGSSEEAPTAVARGAPRRAARGLRVRLALSGNEAGSEGEERAAALATDPRRATVPSDE